MESLRHKHSQSQAHFRLPGEGLSAIENKASVWELEQAWHQHMSPSALTSDKLMALAGLVDSKMHVEDALGMASCFEARGIPFTRSTACEYFQPLEPTSLQRFAKGRSTRAYVYLCEYEDQGKARKAVFKPERQLNPLAGNMPQASLHAGIVEVKRGKTVRPPCYCLRNVAASRICELMDFGVLPRTRLAIGACEGAAIVGAVIDYCDGWSALPEEPDSTLLPVSDWLHDREQLLKNPVFLENMLRLQVIDLIIGEADRNPGNYLVQGDGTVQGIDTEQCFGYKLGCVADMVRNANDDERSSTDRKTVRPCDGGAFYFCDVPKVVTASIVDKVAALSVAELAAILDSLGLSGELGAAKSRLADVKQRIAQATIVPDGSLRLEDCRGTYIERDWTRKYSDSHERVRDQS